MLTVSVIKLASWKFYSTGFPGGKANSFFLTLASENGFAADGYHNGHEWFSTRVARFQTRKIIPKDHKVYQNTTKWYTKRNTKYMYQMIIKCTKWPIILPKFSTPRPSKIDQNCDFWYENIPSGNPVFNDLDVHVFQPLCSRHHFRNIFFVIQGSMF
jgi:hypothetical protein